MARETFDDDSSLSGSMVGERCGGDCLGVGREVASDKAELSLVFGQSTGRRCLDGGGCSNAFAIGDQLQAVRCRKSSRGWG